MFKFYNHNKFLLCAPIAICLLGISVIIGWYIRNETLIHISPKFVAMQYETALTFIFLGAGLIFTMLHRIFISNIISGLILLIASLVLMHYIFNINLGLDQIIFKQYITTPTQHPGPMAPITAICFMFCSIMLLITNHARLITYDKFAYTALVINFLIIGINIVALMGYIFKTQNMYNCGNGQCMALHTVIGFLLWNLGFLIWFKTKFKQSISNQNFIIISVVFTGLVATFLLISQSLANKEYHELIEAKISFEDLIAKNFKEIVKLKVQAIELIALRLQDHGSISQEKWLLETNSQFRNYDSIYALALFDTKFNKVFEQNLKNIKTTYYPKNDLIAPNQSSVYLSSPVPINIYDSAFWIMVPVLNKNQKVTFYAGALMVYEDIFDVLISNTTKLLYKINLTNDNQAVYKNYSDELDLNNKLLKVMPLDVYNQKMTLSIEPTDLMISRYRSMLPEILVIIGIVISFLIYLLTGALMNMQNKSKQLQLLFMGTKAIFESPTLPQAIRCCITNICEIIGWDVGHVYFVSKTIPVKLIPSNIWYFKDYKKHQKLCEITKNVELYSGECLPGKVLQTGETIWIDNIKKHINFSRSAKYAHLNIKSAVGIPIKSHYEVVMVLEFFNNKIIYHDLSLMSTIEVLAENLSKAYAKRELEELLTKKTTELEAYNKEMVLLAYKDPLTSLLNRRAFEEESTRILSYAKRHKIKTAILYTDLDDFKQINDRFGHETGDLLLIEVAKKIQEITRAEDLVARFGGDEFVIFLSHFKNFSEVQNIANKIIDYISQPLIINDNKLFPSISIGIKVCDSDDELSDSIRSADKALYKSKAEGKSRASIG